MTDHSHVERWYTWTGRGILALFLVIVGLSSLYTAIRIGQIYTLNAEIEGLLSDQKALRAQIERQDQANIARLDQIEQVLFGDVLAKLTAEKRPGAIELWQKNRDKELRDRITQLERWRMAHERETRERDE